MPSSLLMAALGAVLAIFWGPLWDSLEHDGRAYTLKQDAKFWVVMAGGTWVVGVLLLARVTGVRFRPLYFFGSTVLVGAALNILVGSMARRRPPASWPAALQSIVTLDRSGEVFEPRFADRVLDLCDPGSQEFSLRNALACAYLALMAYKPGRDLMRAAERWTCSIEILEAGSHFGLVAASPSVVIVAFRGTDDVRDWLTNVSVRTKRPWTDAWGGVHSGFLGAVDALWPQLIAALTRLRGANQPLWLTGHSLGGAMATLAAARLTVERPDFPVSQVYTFGQPLVGDSAFCQAFDARLAGRLVRLVLCKDDVPSHPSGWPPVGQLKYFDRHGRLREAPGRWEKLFDQLRRDSPGVLAEHRMLQYLRLVETTLVTSPGGSDLSRRSP